MEKLNYAVLKAATVENLGRIYVEGTIATYASCL